MTGRVLVVTNDFPPHRGGIESFVLGLVERLPPDRVVVYASRQPGAAADDATRAFPVVRDRARVLLPTPLVARRVARILCEHDCTAVLFGASAPLGLLAPGLRAAGARRLVGLTHGHETWWARVPVARALLRRIGDATDTLTYLAGYTRTVIAPVLSPEAAARLVALPPGVDADRFRPRAGGAALRARHRIAADRPVVLCVGRLTRRKGQDTLVGALPAIVARVPDALLVLVGTGPDRGRLEKLVAQEGVAGHVLFAGRVGEDDLPAWYDATDVFAMPCRTRRFGLEHEGLGMVFLEASAAGVPVVVGDSGGAPDACLPGLTGVLVDPLSIADVAAQVGDLLLDRDRAAAMGRAGRDWVTTEWRWDVLAARLRGLLDV